MMLKVPTHPLFEYLQTKVRNKQFSFNPEHININMSQGPLGFTDTRLVGDNFHFDCHSTLVLPHALILVFLQVFLQILLKFWFGLIQLYTKFQPYTMSGTGKKVYCGGGGGG